MSTNRFLGLDGASASSIAAIGEYSCSFVAEVLFFKQEETTAMKDAKYGRFILRLAGFALVMCVLTSAARAQVTTGSILGTVRDNSGAAVKGARVTVTDLARSATNNYTTDEEGNY